MASGLVAPHFQPAQEVTSGIDILNEHLLSNLPAGSFRAIESAQIEYRTQILVGVVPSRDSVYRRGWIQDLDSRQIKCFIGKLWWH